MRCFDPPDGVAQPPGPMAFHIEPVLIASSGRPGVKLEITAPDGDQWTIVLAPQAAADISLELAAAVGETIAAPPN